jgi:hypothetical protein
VEEGCLKVIPVKADPIQAFRGQGKGGGVERLLKERGNDLRSE